MTKSENLRSESSEVRQENVVDVNEAGIIEFRTVIVNLEDARPRCYSWSVMFKREKTRHVCLNKPHFLVSINFVQLQWNQHI